MYHIRHMGLWLIPTPRRRLRAEPQAAVKRRRSRRVEPACWWAARPPAANSVAAARPAGQNGHHHHLPAASVPARPTQSPHRTQSPPPPRPPAPLPPPLPPAPRSVPPLAAAARPARVAAGPTAHASSRCGRSAAEAEARPPARASRGAARVAGRKASRRSWGPPGRDRRHQTSPHATPLSGGRAALCSRCDESASRRGQHPAKASGSVYGARVRQVRRVRPNCALPSSWLARRTRLGGTSSLSRARASRVSLPPPPSRSEEV